jgi:uncharacterized protein YbaR (Trm112 family)
MLDLKLLNVLACPECQIDVVYRRVGKHEELVCSKCGRVFEVNDGIPVMSPKEK